MPLKYACIFVLKKSRLLKVKTFVGAFHCMFVLAAIFKCWLSANLYRLPPISAGDGRGSSGIGRGKSIGLAEGILLQVANCV